MDMSGIPGNLSTYEVNSPLTINDIVNSRRVIEGPADKLRAVSASKYPWARPLWIKMRGNRWEVEQVQLIRDQLEFQQLSDHQQQAIKRATAFLSNLDAIQTENLAENVSHIITDPDIKKLIARQQFEEWIHVEMYSAIIETLFTNPLEVYDMYRQVPMLGAKNDFIIEQGAVVTSVPTPENKVKAMVSNIALEGIYFFSGFLPFYAVNRATGKINGAVDGIRYIQRDELTHLEIFANCYNTTKKERPELFTKRLEDECKDILVTAVKKEIAWGEYVIDGGIPGVTKDINSDFIWYRGEACANTIGMSIKKNARNPVPWFDTASSINGTHGNFFETKVTAYTENKPTFSRRARSVSSVS
jgi:ribonucleoside-diphosphate reductase beta chain